MEPSTLSPEQLLQHTLLTEILDDAVTRVDAIDSIVMRSLVLAMGLAPVLEIIDLLEEQGRKVEASRWLIAASQLHSVGKITVSQEGEYLLRAMELLMSTERTESTEIVCARTISKLYYLSYADTAKSKKVGEMMKELAQSSKLECFWIVDSAFASSSLQVNHHGLQYGNAWDDPSEYAECMAKLYTHVATGPPANYLSLAHKEGGVMLEAAARLALLTYFGIKIQMRPADGAAVWAVGEYSGRWHATESDLHTAWLQYAEEAAKVSQCLRTRIGFHVDFVMAGMISHLALYQHGCVELAISSALKARQMLRYLREVECGGDLELSIARAEPEFRWSVFILCMPMVYLHLNRHAEIIDYFDDLGLTNATPDLFATWREKHGSQMQQMSKDGSPQFMLYTWYLLSCLAHGKLVTAPGVSGIPEITHLEEIDRHAVTFSCGTVSCLNLAARMHAMLGETDQAVACLERALEIHQGTPGSMVRADALILMGCTIQKSRGAEHAFEYFKRAAEAAHGSCGRWPFLALVAGARSEAASAEGIVIEALSKMSKTREDVRMLFD